MRSPKEFTKIFKDKQRGNIVRKSGVRITKNISYIEPTIITSDVVKDGKKEEVDCTKIFFGEQYLTIDMKISDFLKELEPLNEFI